MSSEIEVVETTDHHHPPAGARENNIPRNEAAAAAEEEILKNDMYTTAVYGDMEKLKRLVELEGCSLTKPDDLGYRALQWAALNNRVAAA